MSQSATPFETVAVNASLCATLTINHAIPCDTFCLKYTTPYYVIVLMFYYYLCIIKNTDCIEFKYVPMSP